jgi:hypothetical protein
MKRVRWSLVYPVFANLICICVYTMKDFNWKLEIMQIEN